jgi:hypothetical protein
MIDVAADLKERFDFAAIWFLKRNDVMHGVEAELSDEDAKVVDILTNLRDSVDAIPPSLIDETDRLRIADPELFESTLVRGVQVVGFGFYPATATEFVKVLDRTVLLDAV